LPLFAGVEAAGRIGGENKAEGRCAKLTHALCVSGTGLLFVQGIHRKWAVRGSRETLVNGEGVETWVMTPEAAQKLDPSGDSLPITTCTEALLAALPTRTM